jgi:hypothetical protein
VTESTRATARVVRSAYGDKADRTYMAGISNGGYLTRWQLENNPQLFDGGLDWEGTLFRAERIYREELDPERDGALDAGVPFCTSGTPYCDADYDYDARPAPVEEAVRSISLTGNIKRPMITVHGDLDTLLPPAVDSDVYDQLIDEAGRSRLHRYYLVEDGTHVDGLYAAYPDRLRPLLPAPGTPSTCSWPGSSRDRLHRPTTSSHGRTTATS